MSLNIALQNALSSLQTTSRALDVTTQNVANVNTEGYSRKIVTQESVSVGGIGAGVSISSITRAANEFLFKELRIATADLGDNNVRNEYFGRMQDLFGTLSSDSSVSNSINDLAIMFQALSDTPEDVALQTDLVEKAKLLAQKINSFATKIEALRLEVDTKTASAVTDINNQIIEIEKLNLKIAENQTLNVGTAELEDERTAAMNRIAEYMDIKSFERANGQMVIFTSNGRMLVDGAAQTLSHTPITASSPGITWADGGISGITLGGVDITSEITSGMIAGLVELRDTILPNLHSQIQELTTTLHDEINLLHNQGTGYPGLPSMTGTRTVTATDTPVWTGNFRITVLDTSGVVVQTQDFDLATINTVGDLVAAVNAAFPVPTAATITANGNFSLTTAATNRLAVNEMTSAVTVGSKTMGASAFLGLNDFFASSKDYDEYRTAYQNSATTALGLAGNLTFRHGATATVIAYGAGDSLTALAATINADAGLIAQNITASIVTDGSGFRLRITDTDGNNFFVTDDSTLIGAQDLKPRDTGLTSQFAIRSDIISDASRVARGQLSSGVLAIGDVALTPGDKTIVQNISNRFNASLAFAATGLLAANQTTLAQYATEILSLNATQANATAQTLRSREVLMQNLNARIGEVSGVNLDEEMSRLIILENAYAAAARIIRSTQELFDLLTDLV